MSTLATLDFSTLNDEQREAVLHPGGPMLIFAGAGSGKTRVISYRIARLIQDGVYPSRILAVTFTNKASREMRERIEGLVGEKDAKFLWMGTFHSICSRILRIDGKAIGIHPQFTIYDDSDQLSLVKDILKAKNIDDKAIQPRAILSEISHAKEQMKTPEKYAEGTSGFFEKICADVYKAYNLKLSAANALDFDDILFYTVRLLEQSEETRKKWQEKFLHVLVDEYQDVNYSQYRLVQLIGELHKNVVVVGDDDQSIYGWRGADASLILKFGLDYASAKIIKLERNYRSTQRILQAANEVIKHNPGRAGKMLWTENKEGPRVSLTEAGTEQDEAEMVINAIMEDIANGSRTLADFAVLYRTNAQSRVLEDGFLKARIPHRLIGGQRFYERKEIKDMVAYLRIVANPSDDVSLKRIINVPPRGIGASAIEKATRFADLQGISLIESFSSQDVQGDLTKRCADAVRGFLIGIEMVRETASKGPVKPTLMAMLNQSGYMAMLRAENSEEAASRLENLQELVNVAQEFDIDADEVSLSAFLENAALMSDSDTLIEGAQAVTLMTIHTAKGLEFPVVFIVGMEEGIFPHSRSLASDQQIAEERRLAYVAMTRAKEELHIVHAHRRSLYGTPNFNPRSRFLEHLPPESLTSLFERGGKIKPYQRSAYQERDGSFSGSKIPTSIGTENRPERSLSTTPGSNLRSPSWKPPFTVGTKVSHAKFGEGIVISCMPIKDDTEVTVAFPGEFGIKKLVQKLAKLQSIP